MSDDRDARVRATLIAKAIEIVNEMTAEEHDIARKEIERRLAVYIETGCTLKKKPH